MCELCRGPEGPPRKGLSRRQVLVMGASVAGGVALGLLSCRDGGTPGTGPGTTSASRGGTTASTGGASSSRSATAAQSTTRSSRSDSQTAPASTRVVSQTGPQSTSQSKPQTQAQTATGPAELVDELFPDVSGRAIAHASDAPVIIVPRSQWTTARPRMNEIVAMDGIGRITVHHTAGLTETDAWNPTAAALEGIREFHSGPTPVNRGWADIAYHFAVDRAGRVWQARPLAYQGAHARQHNDHNLGIVLLGDFEQQSPSAAQLTSLGLFITFLRGIYHVPLTQVFTHGELGETSCPGKLLQEYMDRHRTAAATAEGSKWAPATAHPIPDANLPAMVPFTMPATAPATGR